MYERRHYPTEVLIRSSATVLRGLFDALVRPARFVRAKRATYARSWRESREHIRRLVAVWTVNIVLYAVPLTLAGIGFTTTAADAPAAFASLVAPLVTSPDTAWQLLAGVVQNSVFVTVATGLVLLAFHGSVLLVGRSRGFAQSLHTVVYTTSAYLVGMFTVVMYIATAVGTEQARILVRNLQANVIYGILDLLGSDLAVPGVTPGPVSTAGLSQTGVTLLAALVVLTLYFLYSVYLGARLNHRLGHADSSVVVFVVAASPAAYVAGSAVVTLVLGTYGIQVM